MRPLVLAALVAVAPAAAAAQVAPLHLAVELGFTRDSAGALGDRAPVSLAAAWWLTGGLDATARIGWSFASQTEGRAAAGAFEAGAGLRLALARAPALRPLVVAELAFVQVFGSNPSGPWASDAGVRLAVGAALEVFLARDVSVSFTARLTELALVSGGGGLGAAAALAAGAYF